MVIHHHLNGKRDKENQSLLHIDFVSVFQVDLQHIRSYFSVDDLMEL